MRCSVIIINGVSIFLHGVTVVQYSGFLSWWFYPSIVMLLGMAGLQAWMIVSLVQRKVPRSAQTDVEGNERRMSSWLKCAAFVVIGVYSLYVVDEHLWYRSNNITHDDIVGMWRFRDADEALLNKWGASNKRTYVEFENNGSVRMNELPIKMDYSRSHVLLYSGECEWEIIVYRGGRSVGLLGPWGGVQLSCEYGRWRRRKIVQILVSPDEGMSLEAGTVVLRESQK